MREGRWWARAACLALAWLSATCVGVESGTVNDWRYTGEQLRGPVLHLSRPLDIGGEGVRFSAPPVRCRLVRVEADARELPLSTVLWVTITDGTSPARELLLSNRFGHQPILGQSYDAGTWSVRNPTFEADTDLLLRAVPLEWSEADWLFTGRIGGQPLTDHTFPFPPYDRIGKLKNPRTNVRVYMEEITPQ
jgi:hypothetical protein